MIRGNLPRLLAGASFLGSLLIMACSDGATRPGELGPAQDDASQCSIPQSLILNGGPGKDGIPALSNPSLVAAGDPEAAYLEEDDRVVGLDLESGPVAVPLNIFWWHEIVNLEVAGRALAITHCPLTGSSLAFDRVAVGGAEFGVSGLLFHNNLIMYDRNGTESLWPQMLRGARCGARDGDDLPLVPVIEMTWEGWRALHPLTLVVGESTGFRRDYTQYPYGTYESLTNFSTLFPATLDPRRPAKERVLGIPDQDGGLAFPFGLLNERGAKAAVPVETPGGSLVVFWDRSSQAAMAFDPVMDNEVLTFSTAHDQITDDRTGSVWRIDGLATEGPMAGRWLQPRADAFVAFWFAWPEFYPEIKIWSAVDDD
jgi:hypothetical protein